MPPKKEEIVRLIPETYLAVIKNSVGSKMFQNFYTLVDGKEADVMKAGDLSCAFYVSSILTMFGLIERIHGTVRSTVKDLENSGWKKYKKPRVGAVIVWEEKESDSGLQTHIGFYIGGGKAISNSDETRTVVEHRYLSDRKVELILWNKKVKLNSKARS